jgi:hypothetical protein
VRQQLQPPHLHQAAAHQAALQHDLAAAPLAAALPAGVDLNRVTVGELLHALTAAVTQQAHRWAG